MAKERKLFYENNTGRIHVEEVDFKVPRGWQGGTPAQLLNSAKKIIQHGQQGDPRWQAANWVVEKFGQKGRG